MSGFMAIPKQQFFDNNGNVLAGGKFYTYEVGSTTPKSSYPTIADAIAGTNANSNPVVLDSAGRASIVLGGPTKCVLKDSLGETHAGDTAAGTTIWTVDNVSSDNAILDANGKVILDFSATASAVNYVTLKNSATGNPPIIDTTGTDSAPPLKIQAKGGTADVTVVKLVADAATLTNPSIDSATITNTTFNPTTPLVVAGTSGNAAQLRLAEKTGNGTNYVGFQAPDSISADKLWVLPAADGSANTTLITDGSGTLSWTTLTLVAATQSQQEAASSSVVPVVPSVQQFHPSAAKCWCANDMSGNINVSYNITSITDLGTGVTTITIATDFSSSGYVVVADNVTGTNPAMVISNQVAGSYRLTTFNTTTGNVTDPGVQMSAAFGDQ